MPVNTRKRKTKGKKNSTRSTSPPTTRSASPPTTRSASVFKTPAPKTRKKMHAFTPTNNRNSRNRKPKVNIFATPTLLTKPRNTPNGSTPKTNTGNLNANFGRDISQFLITENKTTYPRLFSGNRSLANSSYWTAAAFALSKGPSRYGGGLFSPSFFSNGRSIFFSTHYADSCFP